MTVVSGFFSRTHLSHFIDYGDIVWSKGTKSNLKRIQKLQNKAGGVILRFRRRTHISCIAHSDG